MAFVTEFNGMDLELYFCTEILKLNSLHYGYFDAKEELNLESVRRAQNRYTETLIGCIPDGVENILDVGCGIGDVSRALNTKKFHVVALSPDINHARFFLDIRDEIEFIPSKYENLQHSDKFDLILMSESQNYFQCQQGFQKNRQLLKKGGYLLVSGMFKKAESSSFKQLPYTVNEFIDTSEEYGFTLEKSIDISENILPTIQYAFDSTNNYIGPGVVMLEQFLMSTNRFRRFIIKTLFRPHIRRAKAIYQHYKNRINPDIFRQNIEYRRLLFRMN